MARVTRSRKIHIVEDNTAITTQEPLLDITTKGQPLTEIINHEGADTMAKAEGSSIPAQLKQLKAAYRDAIGSGKRIRKPRNKRTGHQDEEQYEATSEGHTGEDGEDKLESIDLGTVYPPIPVIQVHQTPDPPATARRITRQQLAKQQAAEYAGIESTPQADSPLRLDGQALEDSLMSEDTIRNVEAQPNNHTRTQLRSPVKTLEEVERSCEEENDPSTADISDEDSFIEQITCRSPAKPVSRIEDSLEALDKLEEAIDALDQAALAEHIVSPEKTRAKPRRGEVSTQLGSRSLREQTRTSHDALAKATHEPRPSKQRSQTPGYASMRVKSTMAKQPPNLKKATSMTFHPIVAERNNSVEGQRRVESTSKAPPKRPISLLPPKPPAKSTKPPTRPTFELPGAAVSRRLKEQREARLAQREANEDAAAKSSAPPKAPKSHKPPTRPTFELPGEAISRRKREAHEARVKAQEEEERKRREFKARPVRKSIVPEHMPRDNVASRARQSHVGLDNMETGELSVTKRNSVAVTRRVSQLLPNQPSISTPGAPGPTGQLARKPSTTSGPSMSGLTLQRTVSTKEVQIQRQRAKEIYNRDARLTEDIERERLEREAAAKRARAEAAERGRQASREWAERQKAKKMGEAGKGMVSGNSPSGQVGFKG